MAHDDQSFPIKSGVSAFGSLAVQVVSVLNSRQAGLHANQARPYIRSILDRRLTTKAYFNPADALEELRAFRLTDTMIVDSYIPEAARSIGKKWVDNELSFADVTIAAARLQSLLTEVEFINPERPPSCDCSLDALVVTCERDQHTLGSLVVAAQLRRTGAMVETLCGEPDDIVRNSIASGAHDAVLFSCSRPEDLETISQTVTYCRQQMSSPPFFVLGGIVVDGLGSIKRRSGVDLVTNDVDMVVAYCAQRSARPRMQASR